jgi:hypothetical protein
MAKLSETKRFAEVASLLNKCIWDNANMQMWTPCPEALRHPEQIFCLPATWPLVVPDACHAHAPGSMTTSEI